MDQYKDNEESKVAISDRIAQIEDNWEKNCEMLTVNHQRVSKICDMENFTNLRRLAFIDNSILKIEGLTACKLLEELSLEKNLITKIEGLSHLQYLKKLDLGRNKIKKIEALSFLDNLTQLSLEDNEISQLNGLENLNNLMELYIGNNLISVMKALYQLKPLPKLIILDISGNPMCRETYYRIYAVFHLKKLKVLDGLSIENSE